MQKSKKRMLLKKRRHSRKKCYRRGGAIGDWWDLRTHMCPATAPLSSFDENPVLNTDLNLNNNNEFAAFNEQSNIPVNQPPAGVEGLLDDVEKDGKELVAEPGRLSFPEEPEEPEKPGFMADVEKMGGGRRRNKKRKTQKKRRMQKKHRHTKK